MSVRWREDRGRHEVRWREGGRQRSRLFRTEQDAQDFDNELYRQRRMGVELPFDKGRITLQAWCEEAWAAYMAPDLAPATRTTYAYQWDKHVMPALGGYELRALTPGVIARFQADLRRDGVGDSTIRRVMSLLQGVLKHAVIHGHITSNPVAAVGRPKQKTEEWPEPVPPIVTERILDAMPHPRDRMLVALVAYAGLRPGEALRLDVSHIRGSKLMVFATKRTTVPRRVIDIIAPLREEFDRYLQGRTTGRLILRADGQPFNDTTWRNWRSRVWHVYGAPLLTGDRRLYRLRGSFASLLAWAGRPITYVARQLGHSVETCSRYYLGIFEMYDAADQIEPADAIYLARLERSLLAVVCRLTLAGVPPVFPNPPDGALS